MLFNKMYDPVESEGSISLPIQEFLLHYRVKLIQKTKDTDTLGKYLLITQSKEQEKVCEKVHMMCKKDHKRRRV